MEANKQILAPPPAVPHPTTVHLHLHSIISLSRFHIVPSVLLFVLRLAFSLSPSEAFMFIQQRQEAK